MVSQKTAKLLLIVSALAAVIISAVIIFLLTRPLSPPAAKSEGAERPTEGSKPRLAFAPHPIGDPIKGHPMITHVTTTDLDQDGLLDILACDGETDSIRWLRQTSRGVFTESQVGDPVRGPAHVSVCDLNGDGKPELLVAGMGIITPNNDKVGSVVIFENLGEGQFRNHVLIEGIARVTDIRGTDLNSDGKIDLVVGQFGYVEGEIRWLENLGDWKFNHHLLLSEPGTIHTPVADFNGDGLPDFAALVSQDAEAVHLFTGDGQGRFRDTVLWKSTNTGWGSSGLDVCDLNRDGRPDLIYTNGDGFDGLVSLPAWHGLQWLENRPDHGFIYHRISDFPGCYSPVCADLDRDGNRDIVAVSAFNNWYDAKSVSLMAWMNNGSQQFTEIPLARSPTHLLALAIDDLDGDGILDIVTGGFHIYPPWTNMSRITFWKRR